MRVALSVDMEGISGVTTLRQVLAATDDYWDAGRPALVADVVAAAEGLLAGGATDVVVLDNHGSGNPANIGAGELPDGARVETWELFDLREHGVDAQFQVGYHARGGVEGFISHTYVPGVRLRVGGELISESHGRAWAGGGPLLGIVGNDMHERTLGSLSGTPFLVVQRSRGRAAVDPVYDRPEDALEAIRSFAEEAARNARHAPPLSPPRGVTLEASLPPDSVAADGDGSSVRTPFAVQDSAAPGMEGAGWRRVSATEYAVDLADWSEARGPLGAAMMAGFGPYLHLWAGDLTSPEAREGHDPEKLEELARALDAWCEESQPEWWSAEAVV